MAEPAPPSLPRVHSPGLTPLTVQLRDGRLDLRASAPLPVELTGATLGLVIRRGRRRLAWQAAALGADGLSAHWPDTGLRMDVRSAERDGALVISASVEHAGTQPVVLEEIAPLLIVPPGTVRVGEAGNDWSVFRNGYQSWSGTRAYSVHEVDADPFWSVLRESHVDARHRASGRPGELRSDLVTAIVDRRSGAALAIGFLDARDFVAAVVVEAPHGRLRRVAAVLDGDGITLRPGQRLELPPLWLAAGGDGEELLGAWAAAAGETMEARVADRAPVGWCSWYYYFNRVREDDIVTNLEALRALRERLPCEFVLLDDGYQRAIGDWLEPNEKFPHGLRWLADRIAGAGFDAGIWMAPFLVRPDARLFSAQPSWLLRTPSGHPRRACWNPTWSLGSPAYALDTTHPEVLEWLSELARTAVHQWGFHLLKLDFLYAAALPGVRFDRNATRAQALRRALQALRDGAGGDAFLLGCGCPLGPAVGLVDAMRIGPDVAPFWTNWMSRGLLRDRHGVATKNALRNALTRAFMHGRLWLNDPDCVIARTESTALTLEEVRTLAAAVALSDGLFVLGDRIDTLPEERLTLLRTAFEVLGGSAHVLDLFARDPPELVRSARDDGDVIGVFNFGARPSVHTVHVGAVAGDAVRELWSGEVLPVHDGRVTVPSIPAHGCRLLWCEPPPAPKNG